MTKCIFCDIVNGKLPSYTFWEDSDHIAFLTPYPNTLGATVVIPRKHFSSYAFELPDTVLSALTLAAKQVGKILDLVLPDVGRTGMVFEGFGVNHVHAKLFPMHGTADMQEWKPITSNVATFFDEYLGYLSTHDCKGIVSEKDLTALMKQLINHSR